MIESDPIAEEFSSMQYVFPSALEERVCRILSALAHTFKQAPDLRARLRCHGCRCRHIFDFNKQSCSYDHQSMLLQYSSTYRMCSLSVHRKRMIFRAHLNFPLIANSICFACHAHVYVIVIRYMRWVLITEPRDPDPNLFLAWNLEQESHCMLIVLQWELLMMNNKFLSFLQEEIEDDDDDDDSWRWVEQNSVKRIDRWGGKGDACSTDWIIVVVDDDDDEDYSES